jgi:hypothetical protein
MSPSSRFQKLLLIAMVGFTGSIWAQTSPNQVEAGTAGSTLPRLVKYTGSAPAGSSSVTFAIYDSPSASAPLWLETQSVTVDESGRYSVLLGSTQAEGLPADIFASGEARWLGVKVGEATEGTRTMLVSVPYALKAGDAETLGGKPLSAFVMADSSAADSSSDASSKIQRLSASKTGGGSTPFSTVDNGSGGTTNFISKWMDATTLANSILFDNGMNIGLGTTTPAEKLEVAGNIKLNGANTKLVTVDTSSAVDQRRWQFFAGGNSYHFMAVNDADTDAREFMKVDRSGVNVTRVSFAGANVGVGTTLPVERLHVAGNLLLNASNPKTVYVDANSTPNNGRWQIFAGGNSFHFMSVNDADTDAREFMKVDRSGVTVTAVSFGGANLGVGTVTPTSKLHVVGSASDQVAMVSQIGPGSDPNSFSASNPPPSAIHGDTPATTGSIAGVFGTTSSVDGYGVLGENLASGGSVGASAGVRGITANVSGASPTTLGTGVWGDALQASGDNVGVFGRSASVAGTGVEGQAIATSGDAVGVYGQSASNSGTGVFGQVTSPSAGSPVPAAVYGLAASGVAGLFNVTNPSASVLVGQTNGNNVFRVDSTGKGYFDNGTTGSGADFAESVSVLEEKSAYEPGDVIAIDTTGVRRFAKVAHPYSTLVAGIYSTKPGVLATEHRTDDPRIASEEIPLAVVGIVPCKVTNENGNVNAGDLLVSSSTAGYAMKGTDRTKMTGAVVGKALQSMHAKSGVIEVLVSLQ